MNGDFSWLTAVAIYLLLCCLWLAAARWRRHCQARRAQSRHRHPVFRRPRPGGRSNPALKWNAAQLNKAWERHSHQWAVEIPWRWPAPADEAVVREHERNVADLPGLEPPSEAGRD